MLRLRLVLALALMAVVAGCGGPPKPLLPSDNRPGWIDKGGGFFSGDKGRAFYGVGAASNISLPSLRRNSADAQARADLARTFKTHINDLGKIYSKSVSGGGSAGDARESSEQFASQVTTALTEMDLTGSMIVDRFYDTRERTQYSLVVLDVDGFRNQIDQVRSLTQQAQAVIKANADSAFAELDAMVNGH
jgi:hypothetical protein